LALYVVANASGAATAPLVAATKIDAATLRGALIGGFVSLVLNVVANRLDILAEAFARVAACERRHRQRKGRQQQRELNPLYRLQRLHS
jgi:hypothetical protein